MKQSNKIKFLMELSNSLARTKKRVLFIAGRPGDKKQAPIKAKLEADGWHILDGADFMKGMEADDEMRVVMMLIGVTDTIYMPLEWDECSVSHYQWTVAVKMGLSIVYE